jgi:hypothetical protein
VVDDLLALVVIATVYTEDLELAGLALGLGVLRGVLGFRAVGGRPAGGLGRRNPRSPCLRRGGAAG